MIDRPLYTDRLKAWKDKQVIKAITGLRRCGKSSLLLVFREYLLKKGISENRIIHINFESLEYDGMDYKALNDYVLSKVKENGNRKTYIFLDEIQKIENWEKTVASLLLNKNLDLYITGSNAYMLSSDLATFISGRYVEIKMLPLSFMEFLSFYDLGNITLDRKFHKYMEYGGMPSLKNCGFDKMQTQEMLDGIYSTVLVRDILQRANMRNSATVQKILTFMADNIASRTSINRITNALYSAKSITSKNNAEIEKIIGIFEKAFMFYKAARYDIKGKEILRSLEKYYIADTGLRNFILGRISDTGRLIENIVYFELRRRFRMIYTGKTGEQEIDFIAENGDGPEYYQVCESLSDEKTRQREISALLKIRDSFPKTILTLDNIPPHTTPEGIRIINLPEWLIKIGS
ncbi:MAG: ATP-binding protein [Elusimicrobiales bacterium]|nr:ATP-binding protein [Elusimicrobiales bacterium]